MNEKVHDVAIIGGGIGGSIMAAILAGNGVDVLLAEGTPHPRFTIGESTTPETSISLRLLAARYGVPELAYLEAYAKLGDELCDHVADLRGRQFLIMFSRGFA
ncbi:MAG: tryptophan 7-halogenase [Pseudonocardiales bacterium]|nr:tryptophan 7-halogenase [Pseudonocardiales bacterium]